MNDENSPRPNNDGLWKQITSALAQEPAYVLIFGICALFFLTAIGAAIAAVVRNGDTRLFALALGSFLAALIAALFAIWLVGRRPATRQQPSDSAPSGPQKLTILPQLAEVSENFEKAKELIPDSVLKEIEYELETVVDHSRDWKDGEVSPQAERYDNMLKDAYEEAKKMVFATSVKEYLETWDSPLGQALLKIHEVRGVPVQRVFIVDKKSDINLRLKAVIEKHKATKNVDVRIFLVEENQGIPFPVELSKDFTIIDDGRALGVTSSYGLGSLRARWIFTKDPGNNKRIQKILEFREALVDRCLTADEFLKKYQDDGASGV